MIPINQKDLAGQKFGRLLAVERTSKKSGHCFLWRCLCDCGNETTATTHALTSGTKRSCGCLVRDTLGYKLTGQRFGRLTVAGESANPPRRGAIYWDCLCDCGNAVVASSYSLVNGIRRSCGCLHRETAGKQAATGIWRDNLRDGTNIKTIQSDKPPRHNTSGVKGVGWHKGVGMWQARIMFQGVTYNLGYYKNLEDAAKARKAAEEKYFKNYLEIAGHIASDDEEPTE